LQNNADLAPSAKSGHPNELGLNIPASPMIPPNLYEMFDRLEKQLTEALKGIQKSVQVFRENMQSEILAINERIDQLCHRIEELENSTLPSTSSSHLVPPQEERVHNAQSATPVRSLEPSRDSIETQVAHLTRTITKQQKIIEMNEREKREKNVIITGVHENQHENTARVVRELIQTKLEENVDVSVCKRLGKYEQNRFRPRPILVVLESMEEKRRIMKSRSKLAGTNIFLNNDLTKDQMEREKKLRKLKNDLISHQNFKDKRITIFRDKLYADKQPITEDEIYAASLSQ